MSEEEDVVEGWSRGSHVDRSLGERTFLAVIDPILYHSIFSRNAKFCHCSYLSVCLLSCFMSKSESLLEEKGTQKF